MLGKILYYIKVCKGLKSNELVNLMGVSTSYISEIELGNKKPTIDMLKKFATAFDLKSYEILEFVEFAEEGHTREQILIKILEKILKNEEKNVKQK